LVDQETQEPEQPAVAEALVQREAEKTVRAQAVVLLALLVEQLAQKVVLLHLEIQCQIGFAQLD